MGSREATGQALRVVTGDGSRVTIHVFPHDARFVRDIERLLAAIDDRDLPEAGLRERLKTRLRAWYPMVEVRGRDDLAEIDADDRLWYVMRDGYVGRPRERLDRLHAAMSDARVTSDTTAFVLREARATMERATHARPGRAGVLTADAPDDEGEA